MTLEQTEQASPLSYLSAKFSFRKNIIGQWVVEGNVQSTASVATYKDVTIDIVYYSKTDRETGRLERTIDEFIGPGDSKDFKFKTNGFPGTSYVKVEMKSASFK